VVEFGERLCSHVLRNLLHRHIVFSIPKILRWYFFYDRDLLSDLSRCAWESLKLPFPEDLPSNMVPQLQLCGVRVQVVLVLQVWLIVFAHVVIQEGYGHYEGNTDLSIEVNNLQ
jgi:hypothetical protein